MKSKAIKYITAQRVGDEYGNELIIKADAKTETLLRILLKLAAEEKPRWLARVDLNKKEMYMFREHTKHFFRERGCYGFNWKIITDTSGWEILELVVRDSQGDNEIYRIPRQIMIDHGKTLSFNQQGFELQTFVEAEIIRRYKVKRFI